MTEPTYHYVLNIDAATREVISRKYVEDCRQAFRAWADEWGISPSYYRQGLKAIRSNWFCEVALPGMDDFPMIFGFTTDPHPDYDA